ncbi:unnamed protein product [Lactuca saligna]|uniref:Uncharacterized protein n=1 Tax=Lactuca saligna TaxID=75948 RepID=A0AA35ZNR3_LACSI|nr:unnamed protein product [Lactuca saligna]
MMYESERMAKEQRDKELDELIALRKKFEAEEAKVKNVKLVLETHKSLFLAWSHEHIQKEAIDDPNLYWLEPTISFDLNNDVECQLDIHISTRAFLFHCFKKIEKFMISDSTVNRKLFLLYLKYAKPHYETWSLNRIMELKVGLLIQTEDFLNIQFKGFRGANHMLHEFTLADFPFMDPYDWLPLF